MPNRTDGPGQRLATTLRAQRAKLGWTQEELADTADVTRQTVIRYESGSASNPEAESLRKVCSALQLDIREVLVDLGYVTRDEIGLPPPAEPLPPALETIVGLLNLPAVPEPAKVSLLRHVQSAVDLWAEALGVKLPPARKPKAPSAKR